MTEEIEPKGSSHADILRLVLRALLFPEPSTVDGSTAGIGVGLPPIARIRTYQRACASAEIVQVSLLDMTVLPFFIKTDVWATGQSWVGSDSPPFSAPWRVGVCSRSDERNHSSASPVGPSSPPANIPWRVATETSQTDRDRPFSRSLDSHSRLCRVHSDQGCC